MKATVEQRFTLPEDQVVVKMTPAEAKELHHQMLAFWQSLSVGRQPPRGDSPFALIFAELERVIKEMP